MWIRSQITTTEASLHDFIKRSLCGIQAAEFQRDLVELAQNALQQLVDLCLVEDSKDTVLEDSKDTVLEVTRIGHSAFKGTFLISFAESNEDRTICIQRYFLEFI